MLPVRISAKPSKPAPFGLLVWRAEDTDLSYPAKASRSFFRAPFRAFRPPRNAEVLCRTGEGQEPGFVRYRGLPSFFRKAALRTPFLGHYRIKAGLCPHRGDKVRTGPEIGQPWLRAPRPQEKHSECWSDTLPLRARAVPSTDQRPYLDQLTVIAEPVHVMAKLLRLDRGSLRPAEEALAAAFQHYPLLVHAAPGLKQRRHLARACCAVGLRYALRWGEAYATSPAMEGVAAWIPSPHFPMTIGKMLRAVPLPALVAVGRHGGARLHTAWVHLNSLHRKLAPPDHLVLFLLGVRPEFQGRGFAGRLLRPILARLDAEGRPCYLDTVNPTAVPLYERFGFRVVEESPIPGTPLTGWALVREPQGTRPSLRGA